MYKIQERVGEDTWFDKTSSQDYKYICELCRLYADKFPDKEYRIIEVFIYV